MVTHTLIFALWLGFFAATITFKPLKANLLALTAVYFLATASHGLLDALTRGGESIPFLWPASEQRYGNWGPIPVADIALEFPDPRRSRSIRSELFWVWIPTLSFIVGSVAYRHVRSRRVANGGMGDANRAGHQGCL